MLKFRPLTYVVPIDKIIEGAIRAVPESIYDTEFPDTSHFRPGRGCHSALIRMIKEWGTIIWFLEFGIIENTPAACGSILISETTMLRVGSKHRLISILKEEIDDPKFNSLTQRIINARRLVGGDRKGRPSSSYGVVPHSVLSALLGNIYLHKLDQEIERIRQKHEIPIVQIIKLVLLERISDRRGPVVRSGEEAYNDFPLVPVGDNRAMVGSQREAAFCSQYKGDINNRLPPRPLAAFLFKPSSPAAFLIRSGFKRRRSASRQEGGERPEYYNTQHNSGDIMKGVTPLVVPAPLPYCTINGRAYGRCCRRRGPLIELGGELVIGNERRLAQLLTWLRGLSPEQPFNDLYLIRICHARYADDLPLGIAGTVELIGGIKKRITHFIQSGPLLEVGSAGSTSIAALRTVESPGTVIRGGGVIPKGPERSFPTPSGASRSYPAGNWGNRGKVEVVPHPNVNKVPYRITGRSAGVSGVTPSSFPTPCTRASLFPALGGPSGAFGCFSELPSPSRAKRASLTRGATPIRILQELEKRRRAKHRIHITASHLRSAIHSKLEDLGRSIPIQQLTKGGVYEVTSYPRGTMTCTTLPQLRSGGRQLRVAGKDQLPRGTKLPQMGTGSLQDSVKLAETLGTASVLSPRVSVGVFCFAVKHIQRRSGEISCRSKVPVQQAVSRSGKSLSVWELSLYTPTEEGREAGDGGRHWFQTGSKCSMKTPRRSTTQIKAPVRKILLRLRDRGIISWRRPWPTHVACLTNASDEDIVNRFAGVAISPLFHHRCCDNLYQVRTIVDYQIRRSAISTPARKHKSSARQIILQYSKDSNIVLSKGGKTLAEFPNSIELRKLRPESFQQRPTMKNEKHAYKTLYQ
uniref:Maturase R n=1 Tax=Welwitschia mirabilis TaxID=3377 RepID=A0A0X9TUR9_WELMI|nr:maturase R [Welwitschia mirabilis]AMA21012.1 maturase R [Welwitschia mirabilis]QXE44360.1 maturase-related protein [Welwitschia mirabilis]